MKLLINYANRPFKTSQKINSATGLRLAHFDKVISYSPKDIDRNFYRRNRKILSQRRGNGYWLWKPYFIRKSLDLLDEGDLLFYSDSDAVFLSSIQPFTQAMEEANQQLLPFSVWKNLPEKTWTKRDAYILLGCDEPKYADSPQMVGGFHLWRKSKFATDFADEWLRYAQDERAITDMPNRLGKPNYPEFREHRHDQSIFSLLVKKHGIKPYEEIAGSKSDFVWLGNVIFGYHPIEDVSLLDWVKAKSLLYRVKAKMKEILRPA